MLTVADIFYMFAVAATSIVAAAIFIPLCEMDDMESLDDFDEFEEGEEK